MATHSTIPDPNSPPVPVSSAEWVGGAAAEALFSTLYAELHRLAMRQLRRSAGGGVLGATTVLHEAYLQMSSREGTVFADRAHFMAYAARVMRGVIIDCVRERGAQKRGGQFKITSLDEQLAADVNDDQELKRIADAVDELAEVEPELAHVVDLKFFCGLSFVDIAALRSVSERTVQRSWEKARIYLHRALQVT
jgi:RNA polymerase sigma factor (TIGR02999 family)